MYKARVNAATDFRRQIISLPTSETRQDLDVDAEEVLDDEGNLVGTKSFLGLDKSLVVLQALRQSRLHHLHNLFPIFSTTKKPRAKPKASTAGVPNTSTPDDEEELPPHEVKRLAKCRLEVGPFRFEGVELFECRFMEEKVQPVASTSTLKPLGKATHIASGAARPAAPAPASQPLQAGLSTQSSAPPASAVRAPQRANPITPSLVSLVNREAESHPWLHNLIQLAARSQAPHSEVLKLGAVMEILSQGYVLPQGEQESIAACMDAKRYMASGPPRREEVERAKEELMRRRLEEERRRKAEKERMEKLEKEKAAQALADAAGPVKAPAKPLGHPVLLLQFAENPTIRFILPVQLSYISQPTHPASVSVPANSLPNQAGQSDQNSSISIATFLPYRGWGKWSYLHASGTTSSSKKRKRGKHGDLPHRDDEVQLGGFTIAPGPVEQVMIRLTGMEGFEVKAMERVVKEVEQVTGMAKRPLANPQKAVNPVVPEASASGGDPAANPVESAVVVADSNVPMQVEESITSTAELASQAPAVSAPVPATADEEASSRRSHRPVKRVKWNLDGTMHKDADAEASADARAERESGSETEEDDNATKSLRARIFCRLLKRVAPQRHLKMRLSEPLPQDLVAASTHPFDPVLRNVANRLPAELQEAQPSVAGKRNEPNKAGPLSRRKGKQPDITYEMPMSFEHLDQLVADKAAKGQLVPKRQSAGPVPSAQSRSGTTEDRGRSRAPVWKVCQGCAVHKKVWRKGPGGGMTLCKDCGDQFANGNLTAADLKAPATAA